MLYFPKQVMSRVGVRSIMPSSTQMWFSSEKIPVSIVKDHSFLNFIGLEPDTQQPIYARTLKKDRYLQVGVEDKNIRYCPVPKHHSYKNLDEALALLSLPKSLGEHPELKQDIILEVINHELVLRVDGTRLRHSIGGKLSVRNVTLERAITLLAAPENNVPDDGRLGEYDGKMVHIVNHSDGLYYLYYGTKTHLPLPDKYQQNPGGFTLVNASKLLRSAKAKEDKKKSANMADKKTGKKPATKEESE